MNTRRKKPNGYPLPDRTVLYSKKKNMEPIPEVGKKYHCFDDGKIRFSRHFIVEVTEVLNHMAFRRKYPEQFKNYLRETKECYWLFSTHTDKFVVCENGEGGRLGVYTRTKQGGWFGIGGWFNSGRLDVTGKMWQWLVDNIDDFDYTEEEKKRLIEENTISDDLL